MSITLSIPVEQLRMVPINGIALATIADGSLLLHVEPINADPLWMLLTRDAAEWLRTEMRKLDS